MASHQLRNTFTQQRSYTASTSVVHRNNVSGLGYPGGSSRQRSTLFEVATTANPVFGFARGIAEAITGEDVNTGAELSATAIGVGLATQGSGRVAAAVGKAVKAVKNTASSVVQSVKQFFDLGRKIVMILEMWSLERWMIWPLQIILNMVKLS